MAKGVLHLNVEFSAVTDEEGKFGRLATLLGLADADHALGRCTHLWLACTRRGEAELPQWLVEQLLGERGPEALVEAELASWAGGRGDSTTRRLRIGGAEKHCLWMVSDQAAKHEQSSKGGKTRAATASRAGGRFTSDSPAGAPAQTSPSEISSASEISDPESLPPARDPAVPGPDPAQVVQDQHRSAGGAGGAAPPPPAPALPGPLVTAPGEVRAELERHRDVTPSNPIPRAVTRAELVESIAGPYNPNDPRAVGQLAETTYRRVSDALLLVSAELKLPEPLPFPAITPASSERTRDARDRVREEGADAPAVCDRIVANLIAQAREDRSVEWLAEKAFTPGGWRTARAWLPKASRPANAGPSRNGRPEQPSMPTPPKFAPEPRLERSAEDLAAMLAMADAVAADPTRAHEVASLPTAELVKRFGDGQRAPPSSAGPHDDTPTDENLRRRKAAK